MSEARGEEILPVIAVFGRGSQVPDQDLRKLIAVFERVIRRSAIDDAKRKAALCLGMLQMNAHRETAGLLFTKNRIIQGWVSAGCGRHLFLCSAD